MDEQENLKLSVTNFGPIAKAEIDLRPLTVFVGPSNTGKSYLAILIYALHKFFGGRSIGPWISYRYWNRDLFDTEGVLKNLETFEDNQTLDTWIESTAKREEEGNSSTDLPEFVASQVRTLLRTLNKSANIFNNEIAREFGVKETRELIRNRINDGAIVRLQRQITASKPGNVSLEYEFTMKGSQSYITTYIPDATPLRIPIHRIANLYNEVKDFIPFIARNSEDEGYQQYRQLLILSGLGEEISSQITGPLSQAAYYLPADRTGIMHAHRVVVESIVALAPHAGLQQDRLLPRLSGILADFLSQLIGLGDRLTRHSTDNTQNDNLAMMIEQNILQGKVLEGEPSDIGYPEFFYRPKGWRYGDLSLTNASSMVSELAPIVLYLRHVVRLGEVLIIEEPESHLHPKMQVELTRHLAAAVKAGIRVMITTHSEWILDELANLIYASELPKNGRRGIPGADQALEPDQVGAWLFEPKSRPKGSVVKEIKFDADYAGFRSGFDAVAIGTHNSYAEIADRLEELHHDDHR